jgi:hypothetical protein
MLDNEDLMNIKTLTAELMTKQEGWFLGHAPAGTTLTYQKGELFFNITWTCAGSFDAENNMQRIGENSYLCDGGAEFDAFLV